MCHEQVGTVQRYNTRSADGQESVQIQNLSIRKLAILLQSFANEVQVRTLQQQSSQLTIRMTMCCRNFWWTSWQNDKVKSRVFFKDLSARFANGFKMVWILILPRVEPATTKEPPYCWWKTYILFYQLKETLGFQTNNCFSMNFSWL